MKDYRALKRYSVSEWEDDIEWLARRMDFLWDMRDFYPDIYMEIGLNKELQNDFYRYNLPEVHALAVKLNSYNENSVKYWNKCEKENPGYFKQKYIDLRSIKNWDLKEFIKKKNCYLYLYIVENGLQ